MEEASSSRRRSNRHRNSGDLNEIKPIQKTSATISPIAPPLVTKNQQVPDGRRRVSAPARLPQTTSTRLSKPSTSTRQSGESSTTPQPTSSFATLSTRRTGVNQTKQPPQAFRNNESSQHSSDPNIDPSNLIQPSSSSKIVPAGKQPAERTQRRQRKAERRVPQETSQIGSKKVQRTGDQRLSTNSRLAQAKDTTVRGTTATNKPAVLKRRSSSRLRARISSTSASKSLAAGPAKNPVSVQEIPLLNVSNRRTRLNSKAARRSSIQDESSDDGSDETSDDESDVHSDEASRGERGEVSYGKSAKAEDDESDEVSDSEPGDPEGSDDEARDSLDRKLSALSNKGSQPSETESSENVDSDTDEESDINSKQEAVELNEDTEGRPNELPDDESSQSPDNEPEEPLLLFSDAENAPSTPSNPPLTPTCVICLDPLDESPALRPTIQCTHTSTVCAPCLEQHISHAVITDGLTIVTCPEVGCGQTLEYEDVLRGAKGDKACLERYETLLLRRILQKDPNFVWCKSATCEWGQVHGSGAVAPIVICQACHARSCFTHDIPWHTGQTCDQYDAQQASRAREAQENLASEAYIREHAKICPNPACGRKIEKNEGCDHMVCRRPVGCGHELYLLGVSRRL
ncbi:hypothetical protein BDV93DRAFT_556525 [Ceratobasidium sp. AG-I]|nr:hypothetical protein BDV93DRAFT_556525 [Ceratobasidium sp. AG-I]